MYSEKHPEFNCYQRAHQNTLEFTPFYLALVLTGGLRHPLFAAGAGAVYLASRHSIYISAVSS
jgi:glutathione S-transferase